jgi:hypothetical protein
VTPGLVGMVRNSPSNAWRQGILKVFNITTMIDINLKYFIFVFLDPLLMEINA